MTQTSNSTKIFDNGMFSISFEPDCVIDQPLIITIKEAAVGPCKSEPANQFLRDAAVSLDAESSVAFLEFLHTHSSDFYHLALEIKTKSLRAAGKIDEAIGLLRRTDHGNKIGCKDYEKGPTRRDLFVSCALYECSEEWLAEQLNISLAEVKRIGALWEEDFQERTPETAQKLEEALIAVGCLPEEKEESQKHEEDHSDLIERMKLWGIEHVPLQGSTYLMTMVDDEDKK